MKNLSQELKIAKELARKAGFAVMEIYRKKIEVKYKAKNNPVTIADLTANNIIIAGLKKFNYGILSEETADDKLRIKKDKVWIVDPLDGTKDFISKTGEFSIMIGLVQSGKSVLGVVYNPVKDLLYYAARGQGSYKESTDKKIKKLAVSKVGSLKNVKMLVSRHHLGEAEGIVAKKLGMKKMIPCGSAGLKIALIAEGVAELNFNTSQKTWEWDLCAADIILSQAGGRLTDKHGKKILYNKKHPINLDGYVASNGLIHKKIIGELKNI